jgi:hypothetical protein
MYNYHKTRSQVIGFRDATLLKSDNEEEMEAYPADISTKTGKTSITAFINILGLL